MEVQSVAGDLIEFVACELLRGDAAGLDTETPLLTLGILDSMSVMDLLEFIEDRYRLRVPDEELAPQNLVSLGAIAAMVVRLAAVGAPPRLDAG